MPTATNFSPERQPDEDFTEYKIRRKLSAYALKMYLRGKLIKTPTQKKK